MYFFGLESFASNFHPAIFTLKVNGKEYLVCNSEQAFMLQKAIFFKDRYAEELIIKENNKGIYADFINGKIAAEQIIKDRTLRESYLAQTKAVKQLGRKVKNFDNDLWDEQSYAIMLDCLKFKFQKPDLKALLLANSDYVEASPYDRKWGIGFSARDADANKAKWGQNLLGKALTELKMKIVK